jgi:biotin transport system substrate-specific component
MTKVKLDIRVMVRIALFAAVTAVLAQVSIPLPSGVPITLQTFAVALAGCYLGWKSGTVAIFVYIALGTAGLPVFASLRGGIEVITGATGGFIAGFLPMAALCGLGASIRSKFAAVPVALSAVAVCHLCGVLWFSVVTSTEFLPAAALVSLPYIIKDAVSVIAALYIAPIIKAAVRF